MLHSRYRLCWCSCLALVLLRVAVGWHFLYEGLSKINSHRKGTKPFSAAGYLANASGPLRPWVRSQLDDPDGLERLEKASLVNRWNSLIEQLGKRYELSDEQRTSVQVKLRELEQAKEEYFQKAATRDKIEAYRASMQEMEQLEKSGLAYERERAKDRRRELAKMRDELLTPVDGWSQALREHVKAGLSPEQIARESQEPLGGLAGSLRLPFKLAWPNERMDQINLVTMCGLTISGGLLMIGLFSRLSALWAAAFLAGVYLINPAQPLGAGNPADFGNYWYVNKELVECQAALVLATIPTGRWLGIDALIRGLVTRRLSAMCFGTPDDAVVQS